MSNIINEDKKNKVNIKFKWKRLSAITGIALMFFMGMNPSIVNNPVESKLETAGIEYPSIPKDITTIQVVDSTKVSITYTSSTLSTTKTTATTVNMDQYMVQLSETTGASESLVATNNNEDTDTLEYTECESVEVIDYCNNEDYNDDETYGSALEYISEEDYIYLCNTVAREYGSDWISIYDKACVVAVVMNRVYDGGWTNGLPSNVYNVLTAPNQFNPDYCTDYYQSCVTQSCMDAVDYYFTHQDEFPHYTSFYGDGVRNYFS